MKNYRNVLYVGSVLSMLLLLFAGCKEDDTLSGAKEVYIEINSPKHNTSLTLGQRVPLRAAVTNISGDTIDTPLKWRVADETVLRIVNDSIEAVPGSQNKATNVYVELENGKMAVSQIRVIRHIPEGVAPLMEGIHYTYNTPKDTVWFSVSPKGLLLDYEPQVTNSNEELIMPLETSLYVDKETGLVGYVFASGRGKAGEATVELAIGPEGDKKKASVNVVLCPEVVLTFGNSFNPTLLITTKNMIMDVSSTDTVWAFTEVGSRYPDDFAVAEKNYNWAFSGDGAMISNFGSDQLGNGHNAWAEVKSSPFEGQLLVKFFCRGNEIVATIDIQDFDKRYRVDELTVDKAELSIPMESKGYITPYIVPESSYAYHQPVFVSENPDIAEVVGYMDGAMYIRGVSMGKTNIIVTSLDKKVVVPVTVTEKVNSVIWVKNYPVMFEGTSADWRVEVKTSSGSAYPATWLSEDEEVAKINVNNDDNQSATVTALVPGETSIKVEAGGKSVDAFTLTVLAVPSEVVFTAKNTDMNSNAAYSEDDQLLVLVSETDGGKVRNWRFSISGADLSGDYTGAYNANTNQIVADMNGAPLDVISGTIELSEYDGDGSRTFNIDLTLQAGEKTFTVKSENLKGY
ncbi:hypothetical protein [Bacteroides sp.]